MKSRRQSGWSFVIVFMVVVLTMGGYSFIHAHSESNASYMNVEIEQGDTLWELSTKYKDEHTFTSEAFVKWVESNNGVNAEKLQPGDTVVIPVEMDINQIASE